MNQLSPALGTLKMLGLPQSQAQLSAAPPAATPNTGATGATATSSSGFSFHDLLSVINPLQHLPVIGTLYRAITGDKIGMPEKIAGDTLYGGLWGAVASIADSAFEALTGKDVGDTVLAMFKPDSKPVTVASNASGAAAAAPTALTQPDANFTALANSLAAKGVDTTLAQRALAAYQKSMTLPGTVLAAAQ